MKARDIMSSGTECVSASDTLETAARRMAKEGVGSMPICGDDDRLKGMLTDRDIVVRAIARGKDVARTLGERIAAPDPDPIEYIEYPAVYPYGVPGGVAVALECPRGEAATTAFRVAERRLRDRLRHRAGTTYEVDWWYERLTRETAHVVIWADALEANIDATRNGLLTVLDDLAERGPTAEELDRELEVIHRRLQDPTTLQWGLIQRAEWELVGGEFETDEDHLDQQRAVTADAVGSVVANAMESMMLMIPQEGTAPAGRFRPYPSLSPHVIQGKRYRPPGLRARFSKQDEWLVASDEGVAFETADLRRTVRYSDAVAVQRWSDGLRGLWSRDGFYVFVDPSAWADGDEIVRTIDARVAPGVAIDMDAGPDALDDPDLQAGAGALEAGDTERARTFLERGLERAPANALGWALLSWCHQSAQRWGDAVRAAERACELDPTLETAQRARSYAYWWTGRSEEAVAAARTTLELEASDADSIADFAWFLADAGEDVEAGRAAQRAVELFPNEGTAWFAAGWTAMLRRDDDAAEEALRRAIELEPANSMWHNNLGWLLLQLGRHREAAECFERALERDASNVFARTNIATALRFLGKQRAADKRRVAMLGENLARAEELVARNPHDFEAHELLIATLRSLGRLDDAVAAARRADELDRERPDTLHALAWALMATGDLDAAAEPLERARRVDPDGDDTLYYVAWHAASAGDALKAREAADRTYELHPHTWGSWEAKGYAAFASAELDEAEQWFGRALHRLPLRCCSNTWSGLIHAERDELQQARARFATASAVSPDCPCPARRRLADRLATAR